MKTNAPQTPVKPEALRPDTETATESTAADANKVIEGLVGMVATAPLAAHEIAASHLPSPRSGGASKPSEVGQQFSQQAGQAVDKAKEMMPSGLQSSQTQQLSTESARTEPASQSTESHAQPASTLASQSTASKPSHEFSPSEAHVENLAEGLAGMAVTGPIVGFQRASHQLSSAGIALSSHLSGAVPAASNVASTASQAVSGAAQTVRDTVHQAASSASNLASNVSSTTSQAASNASQTAKDTAHQATSSASNVGSSASHATTGASQSASETSRQATTAAGEMPAAAKGYVEQVVERVQGYIPAQVQGYLPAMLGGKTTEEGARSHAEGAHAVGEKTYTQAAVDLVKENTPGSLQSESVKQTAKDYQPASLQPEAHRTSAKETTPSSLHSGSDKSTGQIASEAANKMSSSISETTPKSSSTTESRSTKSSTPSGSVAETSQFASKPAQPSMKSEKIPAYTGAGTTERSAHSSGAGTTAHSSEIPVYQHPGKVHIGSPDRPATVTIAAVTSTEPHSDEALRQRAAAALSNAAFQEPGQQ